MRYTIILSPEAADDFAHLKANVRATVRAAMDTHLRHNPAKVSKSRIKRLRGLKRPQYRLRVDDIRIYYDVIETSVEVIAIILASQKQTTGWQGREKKNETRRTF